MMPHRQHIPLGQKAKGESVMKQNTLKGLAVAIALSMLLVMGAVTAFAAQSYEFEIPSIPERPTTSASQPNAYEALPLPGADEDNWYGKPYGIWMAGDNSTYLLSDMNYLISSNTTKADYPLGQPTTVNHPYSEPGNSFLFGGSSASYEYFSGIGMHPKDPYDTYMDRHDSWTVYDISAYTAENSSTPADTFYSLIGLTSQANSYGSKYESAGVYVYIYGDKVGDGQHYELLAQSNLIRGDQLGEFHVNIEGVKLLLIDVILPQTATKHGYSAVGFGYACLFTADENAQKPDYSDQFKNHHHKYSDWQEHSATQHKSTCSSCGDTVYEKHTWNSGKVTTQPSCTQQGVRTYTCTECGYWMVDTIQKAHRPSAWTFESDTQHIRSCLCGEKVEISDHVYDHDEDLLCNDCGYERAATTKPVNSKEQQSGCNSGLTLGAGLMILFSTGCAGFSFSRKED